MSLIILLTALVAIFAVAGIVELKAEKAPKGMTKEEIDKAMKEYDTMVSSRASRGY